MLTLESMIALFGLCLACYQLGYQAGNHKNTKK